MDFIFIDSFAVDVNWRNSEWTSEQVVQEEVRWYDILMEWFILLLLIFMLMMLHVPHFSKFHILYYHIFLITYRNFATVNQRSGFYSFGRGEVTRNVILYSRTNNDQLKGISHLCLSLLDNEKSYIQKKDLKRSWQNSF